MTLPRKWRIVELDKRRVESLQERYGISEHFSRVLVDREITSNKKISRILSPGLEFIHPPQLLPDMESAVLRIEKAIKNKEKILVWGDEDTDGLTATVIMYEVLKNLNAEVSFHIPSRKNEGIGLNNEGLRKAQEEGYRLVITVDCASQDIDEIKKAQTMGLDVIVTDHHEVPTFSDKNFALINPKIEHSLYPFREIAGVTVAFKLGWSLTKRVLKINDKQWESIVQEWLPLVFLGTYADRMPLRDENWFLATLGFNALPLAKRKGIKVLIKFLSRNGTCSEIVVQKIISVLATAKTTGWMQNSGFNILTTEDEEYLNATIPQLIKQSETWYKNANKAYRKLLTSLSGKITENVIFLFLPFVPFEYLGFCASRLRERFGKPVIVVSDKGDLSVGEARAMEGFDIHQLLQKHRKLFISFGGHKVACGFKMEPENVENLKQSVIADSLNMKTTRSNTSELKIISVLQLEDISEKVKTELLLLSPFGSGNPPPLFLARNMSFAGSNYTYEVPDTGEVKSIEIKGGNDWVGIDGKPINLDLVYYFNSVGTLIIVDARPSLFNKAITQA